MENIKHMETLVSNLIKLNVFKSITKTENKITVKLNHLFEKNIVLIDGKFYIYETVFFNHFSPFDIIVKIINFKKNKFLNGYIMKYLIENKLNFGGFININ